MCVVLTTTELTTEVTTIATTEETTYPPSVPCDFCQAKNICCGANTDCNGTYDKPYCVCQPGYVNTSNNLNCGTKFSPGGCRIEDKTFEGEVSMQANSTDKIPSSQCDFLEKSVEAFLKIALLKNKEKYILKAVLVKYITYASKIGLAF